MRSVCGLSALLPQDLIPAHATVAALVIVYRYSVQSLQATSTIIVVQANCCKFYTAAITTRSCTTTLVYTFTMRTSTNTMSHCILQTHLHKTEISKVSRSSGTVINSK
jgi:hypothetical protein